MEKTGYLKLLFTLIGFLNIFILLGIDSDSRFKQLSVDQGLPGEIVHCAFQDSRGVMWFGIESVGLCKYNGRKYTLYQSSENNKSISNNIPRCIAEDKEGYLWIGTENGLNRFDRQTGEFTRYYYSENNPNSIPNNVVYDIVIDEFDNIWMATRKGLCKYTKFNDRFDNLLIGQDTLTDGVPALITSLYYDTTGNIWIGSYSSGLFLVESELNKKHSLACHDLTDTINPDAEIKISKHWLPVLDVPDAQRNYAVQDICHYNDSTLLIGKVNELIAFNLATEKFSEIDLGDNSWLTKVGYNNLLRDSRGVVWAGTSSNGLVIINPEKERCLLLNEENSQYEGFRSNNIRALYEDNQNLIWVCTKFHGIFTYDKLQENFNKHPYNQMFKDVKNLYALSFVESKEGALWLGTKRDGVFLLNTNTGQIKNFNFKNSDLSSNRIEALAVGGNGYLWIGTDKGVNRLSQDNNSIKRYDEIFIRSLSVDTKGNVWVGSGSTGLYYIDNKRGEFERYSNTRHKDFFSDANIRISEIVFMDDTLLWIATYQDGLYKYNFQNDELTQYVSSQNDDGTISGNMVRAVYRDKSGNVWVSSKSEGLNLYDKEQDRFIRMKNKYPSMPSTIYSIEEDEKGYLWLGSQIGLVKFNYEKDELIIFDDSDGLKNNVFEIHAHWSSSDEWLLFGGSKGINFFNPHKVLQDHKIGQLTISSLMVYDRIVAEDITSYGEYRIPFSDKFFSIEFSQNEYDAPNKIQYKYKLKNFDKDWVNSGPRNYASYTSLPPGEYIFKLLATNSKGEWRPEPLEIKIVITSPFWLKPIFIISSIVFVLLLAIIIYVLRLRFISRNEIRLKELVEHQTVYLKKANRELEDHRSNLEKLVKERTRDLEEARAKAEKSDKLKSIFLSNMSHEIRTPLNAIIGLSNLLTESKIDEEEYEELTRLIDSNGKALLQLINDIIDISKIEADQLKIYEEQFSLNQSMKNVADIYYKHLDLYGNQSGVKINLTIPSEDINIVSDKARVEQILRNLMNNAVKFTEKGSITIGYKIISEQADQNFICFFVKDTGIGIAKEKIGSIFDRFIKNESKKNIYFGGTGLGLSISSNLARLLGGTLWVESEEGAGATFFFQIPLKNPVDIKIETPKREEVYIEYDWSDKVVLVVEDNHANYCVIRGILMFTKIKVLHCRDGETALKIIDEQKRKPDLVLMDIKLPGMDGIETAQLIKKNYQNIPIIAQTAFAMDYEEKMIIQAGFDEYIAKPLDSKLLIRKMVHFIAEI